MRLKSPSWFSEHQAVQGCTARLYFKQTETKGNEKQSKMDPRMTDTKVASELKSHCFIVKGATITIQ